MTSYSQQALQRLPGWAIAVLVLIAVIISVLCWNYTLDAWFGLAGKTNPIPQWVLMLTPFVPGVSKLTIPVWFVTLVTFSYVL